MIDASEAVGVRQQMENTRAHTVAGDMRGYRYLARVDDHRGDVADDVETLLHAVGLDRRASSGPIDLFATPTTPTLLFADGSLLIGHLFSREGVHITSANHLPAFASGTQLRSYLIEQCWGEYVLLQRSAQDPRALTIVRDPSGGVPCLYAFGEGAGFVTSDIGLATRADLHQKRVDWDYITRCLTFPHQTSERTGLVGVKTLLPGCALRVTASGATTERVWNPWDFVAPERRITDLGEAAGAVRKTVASAVNAWASVDQSILLELSGGLDSSIVATCLRDPSAHVVCCTLITPIPGADERPYARLIADALGVPLHAEELTFDRAHFMFDPPVQTATPRVGCLQDAINDVMGAAGRRHEAAAFYTGAGGDTVFAYLTNASPAADAFRARGRASGFAAIRDLSQLHQCTLWMAAWLTLRKCVLTPRPPTTAHGTFVAPAVVASQPEPHPWFDAPASALPGDRERVFGLAQTQAYREIAPRANERYLRMPLLAQPVVETCLRIPSWLWIAGGQNRAVARAAFADVLPPAILTRRSKGNFVSYLGGVYRRNRTHICDLLLSGQLQARGLLDTDALKRFLAQPVLPTRDRSFLEIIDLCMIENWLHHQR